MLLYVSRCSDSCNTVFCLLTNHFGNLLYAIMGKSLVLEQLLLIQPML